MSHDIQKTKERPEGHYFLAQRHLINHLLETGQIETEEEYVEQGYARLFARLATKRLEERNIEAIVSALGKARRDIAKAINTIKQI